MKSRKRLLIGISVLASFPFGSIGPLALSASADDLLSLPVHQGESLMEAVNRLHPCPFQAGDKSLQKVVRYNPETVGKDGKFTLTQTEIKVPQSFMETATSCRAPASAAHAHSAEPSLQVEGHASGGGEAVAIEPKELHDREHGEEENSFNMFRIGTFLEYSKLSANNFSGNSADLTSNAEYGLDIEYDRWINRSFFVGARFKLAHSAFQELDARELKEESTSAKAASLTAGYDLGHKTIITFDVSGEQIDHVLFHDAESVDELPTVYVEKVWVPKLTLGVKSVFFEVAGFEIGGGIAGALYLPARGIAKTSPSESAEVFVERELNPFVSVELGFGAQFVRQGFVDGTQSYTSYGGDFGLGFHF